MASKFGKGPLDLLAGALCSPSFKGRTHHWTCISQEDSFVKFPGWIITAKDLILESLEALGLSLGCYSFTAVLLPPASPQCAHLLSRGFKIAV